MEAKLVAVCVFLTCVVGTVGRPCAANLREYVYVRYGQYQELQCCDLDNAELLDTLWYKYDEESQSWELLEPERSDILFLERNATIAFKHVDFSDTGRFKCARTAGNSVQPDDSSTEFDVKVVACDQLARGPFPIAPLPCGVTSANVGDHVTIPCTGYFGCDQDDDRFVTWFMKAKASDNSSWVQVSAADDRITQTQIDSHDGVLASNLTVSNVEARDTWLEFMCILYSTQYIEGQSKVFTSIHIVKDCVTVSCAPIPLPVFIIPAVAASVVAVAVTLLTICLCRLKAKRKLKYASHGNVLDATRFIHKQNVTSDAVKPNLV
ncbi:uncharacterized protein LOC127834027 [Dreissena polymorpha]|uniref:uncharacterized protein LOC127834027 n=1 Tax=Dreissena polymorpha TaxID=45954 RepID=UPI002263EE66|nr:uncharacterized protein LOC127834027 [Dreissena polymorpha]XP_052215543.1 uncharacterized protein LOC127834027 [Dreissena polymorpha]XP_052215544.1 uncharacterized protein LOC127834027 [Dreissena polymorpha]XP_052215545.1 uncharacterized protein LOC127834027 [Dreissena polymorpha]XP_052215546.1 uncharacterized protein LOC127834027 [Dreissena polymorpha]XP_052215547.1 uncharacterized protein LOC127834027 [Dreissena polymorpha]